MQQSLGSHGHGNFKSSASPLWMVDNGYLWKRSLSREMVVKYPSILQWEQVISVVILLADPLRGPSYSSGL
jgi:hypothetical protein